MRNKVFIALAAMMALAATSCQKEEAASAIQFTASAEPTQGKVFYNQQGLFWNSASEIRVYPLAWNNFQVSDGPMAIDPDWIIPYAVYNPTTSAPYAQSATLAFNSTKSYYVSNALASTDGPFVAATYPANGEFVDQDLNCFAFDQNARRFRFYVGSRSDNRGNVAFSDGTTTKALPAPMVAYLNPVPTATNNLQFYHLCGLVHVNITLPSGYNLSDYNDFSISDVNKEQVLDECDYDVTFNLDGSIYSITRVNTGVESTYVRSNNPSDCSMFVNPGTYTGLTFRLRNMSTTGESGFSKVMKDGAQLVVDRAGITTVNITFTEDDYFENEWKK